MSARIAGAISVFVMGVIITLVEPNLFPFGTLNFSDIVLWVAAYGIIAFVVAMWPIIYVIFWLVEIGMAYTPSSLSFLGTVGPDFTQLSLGIIALIMFVVIAVLFQAPQGYVSLSEVGLEVVIPANVIVLER